MRLAGVEIPQRLIDAYQRGELVIFVGAGASFDSGLPSYLDLAARIGDDAFLPMPADMAPDAFLSHLVKDHDVPVHDRAVAIVGNPESKPNDLHGAIASLVSKSPAPRVVTTNYDRHLTTALSSLGVQLEEYSSPALPLGDHFKGLVHLHGRVDADPAQCVVTSHDFGRAYLTDAWAARFLRAMFSTYDVLFVGYSLNDVVVGYLTQALGAGPGRRFALLSSSDERANAMRLGIEPISYEVSGDDHSRLHQCIAEWAELAGMSLVDHARRIEQLLGEESPTAAELAYLQDVISDEARVAQFTRTARGDSWLEWAADQPVFREALASQQLERGDVIARTLMTWFGEHYVTDQDMSQKAWTVFENCGGQFSPAAWDAIGWTVGRLQPDARGSWIHRWMLALIADAPRDGHDWVEDVASELRLPEDELILVPVFDYLTTPKSVVSPRERWRSSQLPAEEHVVEHLAGLLMSKYEDHPLELFFLGVRVLERLAAIRQAVGNDFDDVSYGRSAIEPHEQDDMRGPVDVVIDLVRDAATAAVAQDSAREIVFKRCLASGSVVVRRVALHAMAEAPSPDDDIRRILTHDWLYDTNLHHEVFRLLRRIVADASDEIVEELLAAADVGLSDVAIEAAEYHRLMTLIWIRDSGVSSERLDGRIDEIERDHPEWRPREQPDLLHWSSSGFVPHLAPCTPEELETFITDDPVGIPAWLSSFGQSWGEPTDEDARQLLSDLIRGKPSLGLTVWDAADSDPPTLVAVIAGWSGAAVSETVAAEIVARLSGVEGSAALIDHIARMFNYRGADAFDWAVWEPAVEMVEKLISGVSTDISEVSAGDAYSRAVGTGAGQFGEMLLRSLLYSKPDNSLRSLATRLLDASLRRDRPESVPISHIAMARLADLVKVHSPLVDEHLLPLLINRDSKDVLEFWTSYLRRPLWSDALRDRGFVEEATHVWTVADDENLVERMAGLIISMALDGDPQNHFLLLRASGTDDVGKRAALLAALAHWMQVRDAATVGSAWPSIRDYVKSRVAGVPRRLTPSEVARLDEAVVELGPRFADGVELVAALDSSRDDRGRVFFKLKKVASDGDAPPDVVARFLLHLMAGAVPPFWDSHYVTEIVEEIRHEIEGHLMSRLQEHGLRLGISSALGWQG